ncbi:hypothetical protein BGZ58_010025, partial [Dissophora ornata]
MAAVSSFAVAAVTAASAAASSSLDDIVPPFPETDSFNLSPATSALLALATFLESHGYRDPVNIPGYRYFIALEPLRARLDPVLNPILAFISSHQTLAWIVSLFHIWMASELLFYIHFWTRLAHAQVVDRVPKGPKTKQERRELFQRCLETIDRGEGAKKWVETWFDTGRTAQPAKFEEIGRSNMMH